ncbi:unnamed protein product [Symbiodinium sp. CCMP2456]|nr:unnamed protein product [Symbiodinium sp. CCMP2456]
MPPYGINSVFSQPPSQGRAAPYPSKTTWAPQHQQTSPEWASRQNPPVTTQAVESPKGRKGGSGGGPSRSGLSASVQAVAARLEAGSKGPTAGGDWTSHAGGCGGQPESYLQQVKQKLSGTAKTSTAHVTHSQPDPATSSVGTRVATQGSALKALSERLGRARGMPGGPQAKSKAKATFPAVPVAHAYRHSRLPESKRGHVLAEAIAGVFAVCEDSSGPKSGTLALRVCTEARRRPSRSRFGQCKTDSKGMPVSLADVHAVQWFRSHIGLVGDPAIHLSEISAKESMLEKAQEEIRALQDQKADAEKERQMIRNENSSYSSPELQEQAAENRQLQCSLNMQEELSTELRRRLWEARDELTAAKSMGWQPEVPVQPKAPETQSPPKVEPQELHALPSAETDLGSVPTVEVTQNEDSAVGQAFRHEQEVAQNLRLELREVETAAVATAEAAEARILQIEAMDRRGRVALHMAETAAEKEVVLKQDAIKAACEAEAVLDQARGAEQRLRHEIYEQSQAAFRESAVCDGLRRALMNSVEQEMAQEALHAAHTRPAANPIPERSSDPASKPAQRPGEAPGGSPGGRGAQPSQPSPPRASQLFATKLSNREDLKHDLMSPIDVKSWMEPSMISQPSLLSAAASEAASLRKEAEQLRKEVKHWRASRPARAEPTAPSEAWPASPEGVSSTPVPASATSPRAARGALRTDSEQGLNREDSWRRGSEASFAQTQVPSPRSQQLPKLHEQPPPRPPPGRT